MKSLNDEKSTIVEQIKQGKTVRPRDVNRERDLRLKKIINFQIYTVLFQEEIQHIGI